MRSWPNSLKLSSKLTSCSKTWSTTLTRSLLPCIKRLVMLSMLAMNWPLLKLLVSIMPTWLILTIHRFLMCISSHLWMNVPTLSVMTLLLRFYPRSPAIQVSLDVTWWISCTMAMSKVVTTSAGETMLHLKLLTCFLLLIWVSLSRVLFWLSRQITIKLTKLSKNNSANNSATQDSELSISTRRLKMIGTKTRRSTRQEYYRWMLMMV